MVRASSPTQKRGRDKGTNITNSFLVSYRLIATDFSRSQLLVLVPWPSAVIKHGKVVVTFFALDTCGCLGAQKGQPPLQLVQGRKRARLSLCPRGNLLWRCMLRRRQSTFIGHKGGIQVLLQRLRRKNCMVRTVLDDRKEPTCTGLHQKSYIVNPRAPPDGHPFKRPGGA
jgi:hypothetical protein